MVKKFTFKKTIHTGRYRSFERDHTTIKFDKLEVGCISEGSDCLYHISFAVKREPTKEDPAPFKWVRLKYVAPDEKDARNFVNKYRDRIHNKYNLHQFED